MITTSLSLPLWLMGNLLQDRFNRHSPRYCIYLTQFDDDDDDGDDDVDDDDYTLYWSPLRVLTINYNNYNFIYLKK